MTTQFQYPVHFNFSVNCIRKDSQGVCINQLCGALWLSGKVLDSYMDSTIEMLPVQTNGTVLK